jgi:hypothetical protein
MISRMQLCLVASSLVVGLVSGCGPAVTTVPVTGVVQFDSKPLDKGLIEFYPVAPTIGAMAGSTIEKGAYAVPFESGLQIGGKYIVRITATRKTGKQAANIMGGGGSAIDLFEQYLPATYNKQSTLEITVSDRNKRKFDFDLKTAGK